MNHHGPRKTLPVALVLLIAASLNLSATGLDASRAVHAQPEPTPGASPQARRSFISAPR